MTVLGFTSQIVFLDKLLYINKIQSKNGKKAVRFDALKSNIPAQKMYERYGFKFRGIQKLYYENTGWADFLFYEMNIYNGA